MVQQLERSVPRRLLAVLVAALLALGIWTVGSQEASAKSWTVEAKNFAFSPADLTIAVGDSVTWTNGDAESHAVQGAGVSSPEIPAGGTFSRTFTTAEDFTYICRFHTYMTGTVHVVAGGGTTTSSPTTAPPTAGPSSSTTSTTGGPTPPTTQAPGPGPTEGSDFQEVPDDPSARRPPGPGVGAVSTVAVAPSAAASAPVAAAAAASTTVRSAPVGTRTQTAAAAPVAHANVEVPGDHQSVSVSAEVDDLVPGAPGPPAPPGTGLGDGTQLAESTTEGGVKEFHLTMAETTVEVAPGVVKQAYAFNGIVPGPVLRMNEGDRVRIVVENKLPFPTSTHWHGMILPNDQDGVGGVTQPHIEPGQTYTYEWTAVATGTHWYHSHSSGRHIGKGLYGALEVVPAKGDFKADRDYRLMLGDTDLGFTLNGRSFPSTPTLVTKVGDTVRLRLINTGDQVHAMHLHGVPFEVVAQDGMRRSSPERMDTLTIAPGQTFDLLFRQEHPGTWLVHCHMFIHSHMNADTHPPGESGMNGMVAIVDTAPSPAGGGGLSFLPISNVDLPGRALIALIGLVVLVGSLGSVFVVRHIRQN